jgi:hypothetical protein
MKMKMMETTEEATKRLAFERQPRESSKAYAAFKAYLDLGPQRTLAAMAKLGRGSERSFQHWARRFGWKERIRAYDAHLAEVERLAIERFAKEKAVEWWKLQEPTRRLAWQEAEQAIELLHEARVRWRESDRVPSLGEMARLLDLAIKLKQFAAGMPSEIKEVNATVTGKVSMEWEAAIRKAYGVEASPQPPTISGPDVVVDVEEVGAQSPVIPRAVSRVENGVSSPRLLPGGP